MSGAQGGILSAARVIREGVAVQSYDLALDIPITRYELTEGDQVLCVNVKRGHEAELLAKADQRAAEREVKA